jgi:anti-anti-sigma regulatory factor
MNQIVLKARTIELGGDVTRSRAAQLRSDLLAAMAGPSKPRVVRLTRVEAIDSAGVQLLCALLKAFPDVEIRDVPDVVRTVLNRLGAPGLFGGA